MVRREAEVKQITTPSGWLPTTPRSSLAHALADHYARAGDEACAAIREALTLYGEVQPDDAELLIRLDPLTAPPADPGDRCPLRPAQSGRKPLSRNRSRPTLGGQTPPKPCMDYLFISGALSLAAYEDTTSANASGDV